MAWDDTTPLPSDPFSPSAETDLSSIYWLQILFLDKYKWDLCCRQILIAWKDVQNIREKMDSELMDFQEIFHLDWLNYPLPKLYLYIYLSKICALNSLDTVPAQSFSFLLLGLISNYSLPSSGLWFYYWSKCYLWKPGRIQILSAINLIIWLQLSKWLLIVIRTTFVAMKV